MANNNISELELIKALKVIQDACNKTRDCNECLLRNGENSCGVFESTDGNSFDRPAQWCVKEPDKPRVLVG